MDSAGHAAVESGMAAIFRAVFEREIVLRPEMTARDVAGWDSIAMLSLVVGIEERFGITLRAREIDKLNSVGDMAVLIAGKLDARPA